MAENPWYSFYIGDYQQKTSFLSILEHGAYRLLMDHYYATGHPLPSDHKILYRICRAEDRKEKRAIDRILSIFFTKTEPNSATEEVFYRNEKCELEIAKRLKYSNRQSAAAYSRHKPRHSHGNAIPQPQSQPQKEVSKEKRKQDFADAPKKLFEDLPETNGKEYFWQGKIIYLTEGHYKNFKKLAKWIELDPLLSAEDEYLASLPADDKNRKNWFFYVKGRIGQENRKKEGLIAIGM